MGYAVKEIFRTLQGEGAQAGTPMVFVRFAGCNLWTGRAPDRERDAERTGTACPRYCDTDFVGGERLDADEILARIATAGAGPRWLCLTGGEPALQLDRPLLEALRGAGYQTALETNGTVDIAPIRDLLDWVCVSPKRPARDIVVRDGDELKLVWSGQDPRDLAEWEALAFRHYSLQPEDGPRAAEHLAAAIALVRGQGRWRLSVQTHKLVGLP